MKALKWLLVSLAVVFVACEPAIEDDNCYRKDNQRLMCLQMAENMEDDWARCYDGSDPERDDFMKDVIDIFEIKCNDTACFPEDTGPECIGATWKCVTGTDGRQDLQVPYSCSMSIDM